MLIDINRLGMPAGSEFLDVISPQYIGDLIAWGAIGRAPRKPKCTAKLASGLSAPSASKNGTDGNIRIATDAIQSASRGHHFLSVHKNGQVAIVNTSGNKGLPRDSARRQSPNYDAASVAAACPPRSRQTARHADGGLQPYQQRQATRKAAGRGARHLPARLLVARTACSA